MANCDVTVRFLTQEELNEVRLLAQLPMDLTVSFVEPARNDTLSQAKSDESDSKKVTPKHPTVSILEKALHEWTAVEKEYEKRLQGPVVQNRRGSNEGPRARLNNEVLHVIREAPETPATSVGQAVAIAAITKWYARA